MKPRRVLSGLLLVGTAAGAFAGFRHWHTGWGASAMERRETLPGDELPVSRFGMHATRAITIDAPADDVWPWIVQLGVGKAGWYSHDALDNLGRHSSDEVLLEWQDVAVGDPAAPMNPFQPVERSTWAVEQLAEPDLLLWRDRRAGTWVWVLRELPGRRTRLLTRIRISYAYPAGFAFSPLLEIADFPMYRHMLLGIKARAERLALQPTG